MLEVVADMILTKAKPHKIDAIETFLQKRTIKHLSFTKGRINNISSKVLSGFGIRALKNNQLSFLASNSSENIDELLDLASLLATKSYRRVTRGFVTNNEITSVKKINDYRIRDISLNEISIDLEDNIKQFLDKKNVQNISGNVQIEIEERLVANSENLWKREVGTKMFGHVITTIKENTTEGIGSAFCSSRTFIQDWKKFFKKSYLTAKNQKNRIKLSNALSKEVLLSSKTLANIMAFALIPAFYNINLNQNKIPIRKKVFNKNLEMYDDPLYPGGQNTYGFDDEGFPTEKHILVSNGKFRRFLGMQFSSPTISRRDTYRGNCFRINNLMKNPRSYRYSPTVSSTNFTLMDNKSNKNTLEDIMEQGIYIKDIIGVRNANAYTGDFVLAVVEAYEVQNGEITSPIQPCFCSGNIYEILEDDTLLLSNKIQENSIPNTNFSVLAPEILTSRLTFSI